MLQSNYRSKHAPPGEPLSQGEFWARPTPHRSQRGTSAQMNKVILQHSATAVSQWDKHLSCLRCLSSIQYGSSWWQPMGWTIGLWLIQSRTFQAVQKCGRISDLWQWDSVQEDDKTCCTAFFSQKNSSYPVTFCGRISWLQPSFAWPLVIACVCFAVHWGSSCFG